MQARVPVLVALASGSIENQADSDTSSSTTDKAVPAGRGLYRPFLEHTWERLKASGYCDAVDPVDESLASNVATAKGFSIGSVVRMENRALEPTATSTVDAKRSSSPIRYARAALLETLVAAPIAADGDASSTADDKIHAAGIQVLNLVIFPSLPHLPVFGADFVSLPGNKHLLLLDAQPMTTSAADADNSSNSNSNSIQYSDHWKDWYAKYCSGEETNFPWGGAMPEAVTCYVSPNALWTRLGSAAVAAAAKGKEGEDIATSSPAPPPIEPVTLIQDQLWQAFQEHLDLYLDMLESQSQSQSQSASIVQHSRDEYLKYRLENDPARPMLKALYGEEWTEKVLTQVLFPPL